MATLDFYDDLLSALSMTADKDGLITFNAPDGGARPATVDGRRLILPTDKNLRDGFNDELQPFHPLGESISRKGVSPVLTHLQKTAKALIATYVTVLASELMRVAADSSLHKDLPPECSEYLTKVPNATEATAKKLQRLIHKAHIKNALLTVYLKNGGKYEGKAVSRICTIRFPIMDELEKDENTVYGVKLTPKEKKTISALFHYLLPMGDSPEEYSAGSNSKVAPFLDAFLEAYYKITTQINKMVKRYAEPLDIQLKPFDVKFHKHMDNFADYYSEGTIPPLRGNEGAPVKGEPEPSAAPMPQQHSSAPQPTGESRSQRTPAQPEARGHKPSMSDWLNQLNPNQPQHAAQHTQQGGYNMYGASQQQAQPYIPSWQQQQMPPQQAPQQSPYAAVVAPSNVQQGYGQPQGGYGYNQPQQGGYGYNQPQQGGYGYNQPQQPQQGYNMPNPNGGYNNGSSL